MNYRNIRIQTIEEKSFFVALILVLVKVYVNIYRMYMSADWTGAAS